MLELSQNIKDAFLYSKISSKQRAILMQALEIGLDFINGDIRDNKVLNYRSNQKLRKIFSEKLPSEGQELESLLKEIKEKIVRYSIAQSDQCYLSFPDTGNSIAGVMADIIAIFLNQNLIAIERSAPSASFAELQLISWLRQLIGYNSYDVNDENLTLEKVGGMWTSGGNMSNHIAMLIALHNLFPEIRDHGIYGLNNRPVLILSKNIEHFSFVSAANALGIGKEGIIWADSNNNYTSSATSIEKIITELKERNLKPFMVVSVAGNCRTTNIDDLKTIGNLCNSHNIWFHVDACHGGSLLFSDNLRSSLEGIDMADSISLDPHKGLFVTYPSSFVLFKNPKTLASFSRYPSKVKDPNCLDLGLIMPFYGSRGFDSFKLWALIKHLGLQGLKQVIESRHNTNKLINKFLDFTSLFIMLNNNEFYRQAFVFCPTEVFNLFNKKNIDHSEQILIYQQLISKYTESFCQTLYKTGKVIFDLFTLADLDNKIGLGKDFKYTTMAMVVGHPFIDQSNLKIIYKEVYKVGKLYKELMLNDVLLLKKPFDNKEESYNQSPASW